MPLGLREAARLSTRNLLRRSAMPLLLALLVPSASIAVPLTMGDSFQQSLRQEIYDSLGPVDEVVRSQGVMRPEIFYELENDTRLSRLTDGLAPALILPGTLTGPSGDRRDTRVDIIGIDGRASSFGGLRDTGGLGLSHAIPPGGVYLREDSAGRIGAGAEDVIQAQFMDPVFSLESIYTPGVPVHGALLNVTSVIRNEGLGALDLVPRGDPRRTAFVDLGWLMEQAGHIGMNAILVSNNGDARRGMDGTAEVTARILALLKEHVGYAEGGFSLTATNDYVKLENEKIFFDVNYAQKVRGLDARIGSVSEATSYFLNMMMANGSWIAYSTVTALDPAADAAFGKFVDNLTGGDITGEIADDEIVLTSYAATRLGVGPGDEVTLNYTVYDASFHQQLRYDTFRVKHIVDIEGKADDPQLMPPFPGIKGKASCGDWKPPIPINYSIMTQEDLNYWVGHAGTPKAYISLARGVRMWGNDLGNITTVKALPAAGVTAAELASLLGDRLNASLEPAQMGVVVEKIKQDSIESVAGLAIVTEALVAFGSAVTASGMVLIYVAVMANIESRRREIGILRSLGFTRGNIATVFTLEGTVLSLAGSLAGLAAGLLFAGLGVWASNNLWTGILPMSSALYPPGPVLMAASFLAGFLLSTMAFAIGTRAASRGSVVSGIRGLPDTEEPRISSNAGTVTVEVYTGSNGKTRTTWSGSGRPAAGLTWAGAGLLVAAAILMLPSAPFMGLPRVYANVLLMLGLPMVATFAFRGKVGMAIGYLFSIVFLVAFSLALSSTAGDMLLLYYFLSGDLLLLLTGLMVYRHLEGLTAYLSGKARLGRVALANSSRQPKRAGAYIVVYALVVFPLLTISAYMPMETGSISSQAALRGGGYDILGTSEVPFFFDLGSGAARTAHNVSGFPNVSAVQFLSFGSPGGTCSNLNTRAPPRILAANAPFVAGSKIPFSGSEDGSGGNGPWKLLDKDGGGTGAPAGSVVPAIGDYTTVVWIFEKGLGGMIEIKDESGNTVRLKIVAILHDSIFQGSVFVSEAAMKRLYPTQSHFNMFLFKLAGDRSVQAAAAGLESSLSSYGFRARPVSEIAAGFIRVDMAYVSMLQAMLASGVIIGTVGFSAKVWRETLERRHELGVMRALGFPRGRVARLVLAENMFLFLLGFIIALAASMAASFIFLGTVPSAPDTLLLLGLLMAVVAVSTLYPVRRFNALPVSQVLRLPE